MLVSVPGIKEIKRVGKLANTYQKRLKKNSHFGSPVMAKTNYK